MRAGVVDTVLRRDGDDDAAVLERARQLGFAGVEVVLRRGDLESGRLESLRRARAATGVEVPSLVLGFHNEDGGIADADPSAARRAADDVRASIAWARELGADVVLVPFFLRAELLGEADVDRCADGFAALCPTAAAEGVTLCYEGTLPADGVLALAERVSSPAFGCYFDLANPVVSGLDPATEARRLGDLVRRVHFKDARARRGDCRPGLGQVDYAECVRALTEIGLRRLARSRDADGAARARREGPERRTPLLPARAGNRVAALRRVHARARRLAPRSRRCLSRPRGSRRSSSREISSTRGWRRRSRSPSTSRGSAPTRTSSFRTTRSAGRTSRTSSGASRRRHWPARGWSRRTQARGTRPRSGGTHPKTSPPRRGHCFSTRSSGCSRSPNVRARSWRSKAR